MKEKGLVDYFEKFLNKKSVFRNKNSLQANYTPEHILHRDDQIQQLANVLAPCLKGDKPSNIFIYGKTGTGKTLVAKYVSSQLMKISEERGLPLKIVYINCKLKKISDTEYRLIAQLAREFGTAIPPTGLPTDEVYNIFYRILEKEKRNVVLILDEIDQLTGKAGNDILYNLTRINAELKNSQITLVGISNDLMFTDNLDPRVKSSLSEEELVFPPYNALQIQKILKQRSQEAFRDESLIQGVIEKCAAFAAREHGDARRALELLRVAGELAERQNEESIQLKHLDEAEEKIEKDRILDIITTQPKQYHATLYSVFHIAQNKKDQIFTGEVYELYKKLCTRTDLRPLTQRRVSDILAEMDMLGIINAKVISKGRYGRTREISLGTTGAINQRIKKILEEQLGFT
ncbi:ORC1-type DNA replication protein [Candidatus Woesearchaeota archaeon]|nr:ORC1-type DNA replication protein [Candidatus Woesearchaeota archaeon]MBW3006038.1 ORC1-type DNA replication protein [Candidatus Woesearchaeota archaeon]